jgi:hypothetical protein
MSFDTVGIAAELLTIDKSVRPDQVADLYADRKVGLEIRLLRGGDGDDGLPLVVIEGTRLALSFLADLLLAQAQDPKDCGFSIAPDGPGSVHFGENSECGIYIHVLPSKNPQHA